MNIESLEKSYLECIETMRVFISNKFKAEIENWRNTESVLNYLKHRKFSKLLKDLLCEKGKEFGNFTRLERLENDIKTLTEIENITETEIQNLQLADNNFWDTEIGTKKEIWYELMKKVGVAFDKINIDADKI